MDHLLEGLLRDVVCGLTLGLGFFKTRAYCLSLRSSGAPRLPQWSRTRVHDPCAVEL